jgi:hypothetical protein
VTLQTLASLACSLTPSCEEVHQTDTCITFCWQPNLGQGGGQAIESAYTLAASLDGLTSASSTKEIQKKLFYEYSLKRVLRAGSVHGLSRMLGLLNIVYRPYLGSNPYPFYPAPVKAFWEAVRHMTSQSWRLSCRAHTSLRLTPVT